MTRTIRSMTIRHLLLMVMTMYASTICCLNGTSSNYVTIADAMMIIGLSSLCGFILCMDQQSRENKSNKSLYDSINKWFGEDTPSRDFISLLVLLCTEGLIFITVVTLKDNPFWSLEVTALKGLLITIGGYCGYKLFRITKINDKDGRE